MVSEKQKALGTIVQEGYTGKDLKFPEKADGDIVSTTEKLVSQQNAKLQRALKKLNACYYRKCGKDQRVLELVGQR